MSVNDPKGFAGALKLLASALATVSSDSSAQIDRLADVFAASPEKTMAATLKKLSGLQITNAEYSSELASLSTFLKEIEAFLVSASAAKCASQLTSFRLLLSKQPPMSVDSFAEAAIALLTKPKPSSKRPKAAAQVRDDLVLRYARHLEECLGDEGFQAVYDELAKGGGATGVEIVQIARKFTSEKPNSRPKALKAIWNRHHTLMTFRAKAESRAGRSAA